MESLIMKVKSQAKQVAVSGVIRRYDKKVQVVSVHTITFCTSYAPTTKLHLVVMTVSTILC